MIIGFDSSRSFIKNKTGTESYSYHLLKSLAKIDKKNTYIIFTRAGVIPKNFPNNFHFKTINWPRFWTQGGLALKTFQEKLDVLFVPSHTLPIIKKRGMKTVVTVHDLGSEYLPQMHQIKQRLYLSFMQKYQLKNASQIIAVSKATKDDLVKKLGIKEKNIEVVYEGFGKEVFKPINDILVNSLSQFNLKPQEYFLFVGTVQPRKNLTRLIQSFDQFCHPEGAKRLKDLLNYSETSSEILRYTQNDNLKLIIVGSKGWLSDEIYKLPKELGIEDKIKFLGYVPEKDLPALYSGAKAFVFPSLFEGFGLPILEAQACGCPVLTSNTSSMPEVAGKGAILVDPESLDDIVEGMERLQVSGYREQLIKKGLENIKRFSWEKCARETLDVLEKTVESDA